MADTLTKEYERLSIRVLQGDGLTEEERRVAASIIRSYAPSAIERKGDPDLLAWLADRLQNCETIASHRIGADRSGWLEDAAYFKRAIAMLAAAPAPVSEYWWCAGCQREVPQEEVGLDQKHTLCPNKLNRWKRAPAPAEPVQEAVGHVDNFGGAWGAMMQVELPNGTPLYAAPIVTAPVEVERKGDVQDALCDSAYIAGAQAGFKAAQSDDVEALNKLIATRNGYLKALRRDMKPSKED